MMTRHASSRAVPLIAAAAILLGAGGDGPRDTTTPPASQPADATPWQPLPATGPVPSIVPAAESSADAAAALKRRAQIRQYEKQLRAIHHRCLKPGRSQHLREQGLAELREFIDPAAFRPMITVLADADDEVRLAMLDHFAVRGADGQTALAFVAITDTDNAIVNEAAGRISPPVAPGVLALIDATLRGDNDRHITAAASLAGALNLVETIPLLIFAQAAAQPRAQQTGDLAWIAIETQRAYVQALNPVVGTGAAGFAPVVGTISDGSVLRIQDAVVIVYRTVVHRVLVNMTTADFGESTAGMDYNLDAWWTWYNEQYVPFKNEQARLEDLAEPSDG